MSIRLEQIDELRRRGNMSYEDAKEALERSEGDMVEAIIHLERENKIKAKKGFEEKDSILDKIKALIKKGNEIRFIMNKKDKIVLNLSLNVSILIAIFAFHVAIVGLILALICGYRIKLQTSEGGEVKVNQTLNRVQDSIQEALK